MLFAPTIFTEVGETKITGAVVDKAEAVSYGAFFVVFEFLVFEAFLHLLPQSNCKRGHGSLIIILDCSWTLRDNTFEDVLLL